MPYELTKTRDNWECLVCHNPIPKGSYCISSLKNRWAKYCLACAVAKIDTKIEEYKKFVKADLSILRKLKAKLLRNKEKYEKNNVVAQLGSER